MAGITISDKDAIAIVEAAAEAAWEISSPDLHSRARPQPLAFQRQICIAALHDDFAMSQTEACAAFGRDPSYYPRLRTTLTKLLDTSKAHRRMATVFFAALDLERHRFIMARQQAG